MTTNDITTSYKDYNFASYDAIEIKRLLDEEGRAGEYPDLANSSLKELDSLLESVWRKGWTFDHNTTFGILCVLQEMYSAIER